MSGFRHDFLVVGAGVAGAAAGYFLAEAGSVVLLERESVPGYHSTGRSAALFSEYYGGPAVRALTAASRPFFAAPPPGFAEVPLLLPRGVLALCPVGAEDRFQAALGEGLSAPTPVREIDAEEVSRLCPAVRPGWYSRAMFKPAAMDIDVDAVHQGYLRGIRARGGRVVTGAEVRRLERSHGRWHATTDAGEFTAPVVVNAAGAWADEVAALAGVRPIGLRPLRRTAFIVDAPGGTDVTRWPMVADVADTFYFKPESGGLLVSPNDATPVSPGDARPDYVDVALAAQRFEAATTMVVRGVRHAWAGLRSAVPDERPVIGAAPDADGFVWLAALSGYGIQISPSAGRIAAAAATRSAVPRSLKDLGDALAEIAPALRRTVPASIGPPKIPRAEYGQGAT